MKKKSIVLLTVLLLMLTSCTTLVKVNTLRPADVNLASYKKVAVAPTDAGSPIEFDFSYKFRLSDEEKDFLPYYATTSVFFTPNVSDYATRTITQALEDCLDSFVSSYNTEDIVRTGKKLGKSATASLREEGIDCLVKGTITDKYIDQYIDSEECREKQKDGTEVLVKKYVLVQEVGIELTVEVTDLETDTVVFTKTFKDSEEREVCLGKTENDGQFKSERYFDSKLDPEEIYKDLLVGMKWSIKKCFTQTAITNRFHLQSSKDNKIKTAIELAHDGYCQDALEIFLDEWAKGSYEGGYNSAIMYFALGEFDKATSQAWDVYRSSLSKDARKLYEEFSSIAKADEKARDQINGVV